MKPEHPLQPLPRVGSVSPGVHAGARRRGPGLMTHGGLMTLGRKYNDTRHSGVKSLNLEQYDGRSSSKQRYEELFLRTGPEQQPRSG